MKLMEWETWSTCSLLSIAKLPKSYSCVIELWLLLFLQLRFNRIDLRLQLSQECRSYNANCHLHLTLSVKGQVRHSALESNYSSISLILTCFCSKIQLKHDQNWDSICGWKYRCLNLIINSPEHIEPLLEGINGIYCNQVWVALQYCGKRFSEYINLKGVPYDEPS